MKTRPVSWLLAGLLVLAWALPAAAGQQMDQILQKLEELTKTVNQQQQLLQDQASEIQHLKGQLDQQAAEAAKKPAAPAAGTAAAAPGEKKQPLAASLKELIGDKFTFSTDLRLRYEGLYDRQTPSGEIADRHRFRYRWRVFGGYTLNDELSFHSMLTTSSGSWFDDGANSRNWDPGRTSNQSMDDEFNNKNIFIGRIYATYDPNWAPGLEITAGKFKNTFLHTDIMWDPDVNPEGVYEKYQYDGWKVFQPFVQFGQMVVSENNKTEDAYLLLWQGGANLNFTKDVIWTIAGSFYDWENPNKSDLSEVEGSSAGNTVGEDGKYLYDYRLAEGLTFLKFKVFKLPIMLWFDYIENVAGGVPDANTTAWSTGFTVGKTKKKGDWELYFKYAYIEPDAVIGAVNDGDFYGANREGYKVKGSYVLWDPVVFAISWFGTDTVEGPENSEYRLQTDLIFRFSL
ncbi:MAG: putative porin [Deltaproteobacteria bacterium]|nr:putative porin [Deltaproteobacteria bacterium]